MPTGAPDHFKRILLYGIYNGAATPLACDEQGRLILVTEPVSPFDKSGTVSLYDDFSTGFTQADTETAEASASVTISTDEAASAGACAKLNPGADSGSKAGVLYYLFPSELTKLGIEFRIRWGLTIDYLLVQADIYDGTSHHRAQLKYDYSESAWYVYDRTTGDYVEILDVVAYPADAHAFYRFKLVIDADAVTYHRFKHVAGEVDISEYTLHTGPQPSYKVIEVRIQAYGDGVNDGWVYLDEVIITQDES